MQSKHNYKVLEGYDEEKLGIVPFIIWECRKHKQEYPCKGGK